MSLSSLKQDDIVVTCSWSVLNERSIENALTFDVNNVNKEKKGLEEIVSLETCVQLGTQNATVPCTLEIKLLPEGFKITELSVVSEARIIETYGKCGEYLITSRADFIDECEDMTVYMAETKLPQPSTECILKFARLKTNRQMWLYGIHVTMEKAEPLLSDTGVNFQNVNKILKESSHQLTEKAEKCKKFLQLYSSYWDAGKGQSQPAPNMLLKMFEAEYLLQNNAVGTQAKSVSKCLSDLLPGFTLSPKSKCETGPNKPNMTVHAPEWSESPGTTSFPSIAEELKHHIDKRFNQLEKLLILRVDEKLNELQRRQSEKLDTILHLVQGLKPLCVNDEQM